MTTFALLAVVLLPVLSALVIALLPDRHDDGKRLGSLSIVFTLLTLLAMVYVAATADGSTVTVPVMRDGEGNALTEPKTPQMVFTMQLPQPVPPMSFVRHAVELSGK